MQSSWRIFVAPEAEGDFAGLDSNVRNRIKEKLIWLRNNFDRVTPSSLGGDWRGFFKLRVGNWRVIYGVDWENNVILVVAVGKRDEIYE